MQRFRDPLDFHRILSDEVREQEVDRSPDEVLGGERASDTCDAFVGVDGYERVHDIVRAQFV
ncbi:hypothetical protein GCM10010385_60910 [Streptomyces geysiriensis]|nr:hypothetical protein GCM10010385_60910 [Streptomyces geysiriensis]GHB93738.1 hypothetical protein GCM10010308_00330 [Streptomyces vinaceusdrappus]